MGLSDNKKQLGNKYGPINLFIETYIYDDWFENEESRKKKNNNKK